MLQLQDLEKGSVVGKGTLLREDLEFGDICFADDFLVYSIAGRGVYHISVDDMFGRIGQDILLSDIGCLYQCVNPVELAWVKEKHILMIVEKLTEPLEVVNYISFNREKIAEKIEIEWIYGDKNYAIEGEAVEGFCVSNDGKYIALTGDKLTVLELVEDYCQLVREPIEARMSCNRAEFIGCTGLTEHRLEFLNSRGAITNNEGRW